MQPGFAKLDGPGFSALVPASATNTSPVSGSTVIECALVVAGRATVCKMLPFSSTTSKNRVVIADRQMFAFAVAIGRKADMPFCTDPTRESREWKWRE